MGKAKTTGDTTSKRKIRRNVTVGEVSDALREVWGAYVPVEVF